MTTEEQYEILKEHMAMRKALTFIYNWELPRVPHEGTSTDMSYESAYGSNGARDYMRNVAKDTLDKVS